MSGPLPVTRDAIGEELARLRVSYDRIDNLMSQEFEAAGQMMNGPAYSMLANARRQVQGAADALLEAYGRAEP